MSPSTTVVELQAQCERGVPLVLLDVRRRPVFEVADSTIPGAVWRDPEEVDVWSNEFPNDVTTVVYCVHGHGVSQGVAAQLQELGFDALYLEGGIEGWKEVGGETQPVR
jgi:rhodanese-related sulfurtransferase